MVKRSTSTRPADETALQKVMRMLGTGIEGLEDYIDAAANTLSKADDEQAGDFAHVLTKVAQVAAELRKAEKADRDANAEITEKQWADYVRRSSPEQRKQLLRILRDADVESGKSGLA